MVRVSSRGRYFLGDLAATVASGSFAAVAAGLAIPRAWPLVLGMIAGMLLGTALAIPCSLVAAQFLGMIEPMLQIMFACMLAGMLGAMSGAGDPGRGLLPLAGLGAMCGIATAVSFATADWTLRRQGSG